MRLDFRFKLKSRATIRQPDQQASNWISCLLILLVEELIACADN